MIAAALERVYDFRRFEELYPEFEARFAASGERGPGRFGYRPGLEACSYGSADFVFARAATGRIAELSQDERDEWAAEINKHQDEEGWYRKDHTTHHRAHTTAYAVAALLLLGRKPGRPLSGMAALASPESREGWIRSVNWSIIWPGSHYAAGLPAALAMTGEAPEGFFDWYFAWLDRESDPASGFWRRGLAHRLGILRRPNMHDMGGAFHMYLVYERFGRPWPSPDKVVDLTLALQGQNGFWDGEVSYCIDLDGIYCLTRSSRNAGLAASRAASSEEGYRAAEVRAACERFLERAEATLCDRDFLGASYRNSHRLPGALVAVAECARTWPGIVRTERPWVQTLDLAPWI